MSDRGHQCPFVNRADARCSGNFTLDRLEQAYDLCFNSYHACPVFVELLAERRIRRGENISITARKVGHVPAAVATAGNATAAAELVQVTVAAGYAKRTA